MKTQVICKKFVYFFVCILLTAFLFGCKEKTELASIFDGLPESNYLTEISSSVENKKPVIISFTAEWCPHCRKYKPAFFEVKDLLSNEATFINIDVDDSNGGIISGRFQVRGIPTTAFVRPDGSVFKVQVGEIEKEELIGIVRDLLKRKKKRKSEPIAPFPVEVKEIKLPAKEEVKKEEPQEIIKEEVEPEEGPADGRPPEAEQIDQPKPESEVLP